MLFLKLMYLTAGVFLMELVCTTYVSSYPSNENDFKPTTEISKKENMIKKRKYNLFKSNRDVMHYLKLFGTDMMIWRCKNAIQPFWEWRPLPVLELDCETIGVVSDVEWYHNDKKIDTNHVHYSQTIKPHMARGKFFSSWLDFTLKIYNATIEDSGVYSFKAVSRKGFSSEHTIYVDISKKKKRNRKKNKRRNGRRRKNTRRDYERFYLFHKYHNNRNDNNHKDSGFTNGYVKEIKTGKNTYYTI